MIRRRASSGPWRGSEATAEGKVIRPREPLDLGLRRVKPPEPLVTPPPEPQNQCELGLKFEQWVGGLLERVIKASAPHRLDRARLILTDKYMAFRMSASYEHRDAIGNADHRCIYQVWVAGYERLQELDLLQLQPISVEAPPPTPKTPMRNNALVLGGDDE